MAKHGFDSTDVVNGTTLRTVRDELRATGTAAHIKGRQIWVEADSKAAAIAKIREAAGRAHRRTLRRFMQDD